jgi:hypothetical protein
MRNRQFFQRGAHHVRSIVSAHAAQIACRLGSRECTRPCAARRPELRPGRSGPRRQRNPALPDQFSRSGSRRPPATHRSDTVARPGDCRGPIPGRAAGEDPGTRKLLGGGLRLAEGGGEAECLAAVRDRDRRARHSFHTRPLSSSEGPAADHHPWLAGLDPGAREGHRPTHRSHGPWRTCGGRIRSRSALDARLWLLGQAAGHWLGSRPHRARRRPS